MLANRAAPRQLLHHLYRLAPACVRAWMPAATLRAAGPERELYWIFELKKKAQDPHGAAKNQSSCLRAAATTAHEQ